ncbi:DUF6226 family protein [Nocardioides sp. SYSU D00038]|uniref:DUF6226 family protein n=1 Tax=Nocardioides sp. SYSU D00038 TaxID=2812554 RepID=UPI0019678335|nr:DUF6226 family protein [Nocardioides sp. SYSU D00038]
MLDLRPDVAARFVVTGADTPGWPDPHPTIEDEPTEEEYSRLLDPGKYRILRSRLQAWLDVLAAHGAVRLEPGAAGAEWWRPTAAHALPVRLRWSDLDGVEDAVVEIAVGEPPVVVLQLPECGCDACDDGSEQLLRDLDDLLDEVVSGRFAHVTTGTGGRIWSTGSAGWSAVGDLPEDDEGWPDGDLLLDRARVGTSEHVVVHGAPWVRP